MRYAFLFYYDERNFSIVCYDADGRDRKYFNCAEDYLDDALDYVDLFLENGGNRYEYNIPTWEDYLKVFDDDDKLFNLKDAPIEEFEKYRK